MAQYYLAKGTEKLGPFTVEQLMSNGLMPHSLVWCAGMPAWTKAADVPELASSLATEVAPVPPAIPQAPAPPALQTPAPPAPGTPLPPPTQQPQQPQQSQWAPPAPSQVPPASRPIPATRSADQNVFKILLYVMLGFNILASLWKIVGAFYFFKMDRYFLGIFTILSALALIAVCGYSIMKMLKNEKFGFITVAFFALVFVLNVIGFILGVSSAYNLGNIAALVIAAFASIPMNNISEIDKYKNLLKEATLIDYVLLGVYAFTTLVYFVLLFMFMHSFRNYMV